MHGAARTSLHSTIRSSGDDSSASLMAGVTTAIGAGLSSPSTLLRSSSRSAASNVSTIACDDREQDHFID